MLDLTRINEVMTTYIRPQTYPLAVKMLSSEDKVPQEANKPLRDFGVPLTVCQAMALGRKEGLTFVLDKNSQCCAIALVGLGFVRPEAYISGKYVTLPSNQSAEARERKNKEMSRFDYGRFKYILLSPIQSARFDPDVIVCYGNSAQVMRMIQAATFYSGEAVTSRSVGSAGCILSIVASILEGECKFSIPGNGERRLGLVGEGEVAFSIPKNRFEEFINGLRLSHEGGLTYPVSSGYLKQGYKFPSAYAELLKAVRESPNNVA